MTNKIYEPSTRIVFGEGIELTNDNAYGCLSFGRTSHDRMVLTNFMDIVDPCNMNAVYNAEVPSDEEGRITQWQKFPSQPTRKLDDVVSGTQAFLSDAALYMGIKQIPNESQMYHPGHTPYHLFRFIHNDRENYLLFPFSSIKGIYTDKGEALWVNDQNYSLERLSTTDFLALPTVLNRGDVWNY